MAKRCTCMPASRRESETLLGGRYSDPATMQLFHGNGRYTLRSRGDDDSARGFSQSSERLSKAQAVEILERWYDESHTLEGKYGAMGYDVAHTEITPAGLALLADVGRI